jgi:hypothetical protein
MNILHLILFLAFFFTTNAQWYIKKTYYTKLVHYPNPGKRSVPDEQTFAVGTDCSKPFFQLQSYSEKVTWMYKCIYTKSPSKINENSVSLNSNNIDVASSSTPGYIGHENRYPYVTSSYLTEHDNLVNRFLRKLLQGRIKNESK